MKTTLKILSLLALFAVAVINKSHAQAALSAEDAYSLAKSTIAGAQLKGSLNDTNFIVFVICLDNGDGTSPIAVRGAEISVNGATGAAIDHRDAHSNMAFRGHAEKNKDGKRKLTGLFSTPLGFSTTTPQGAEAKVAVNVNMDVSLDDATLIAAGAASAQNHDTKKLVEKRFYVFAYSR